jgi:hypothetical protein
LYEPRATQIFNLATSRAESAEAARQAAQQSAEQSLQQGEQPNEATLTTDRQDYAPYSYVYISGTGFDPGETVNMIVVQLSPNPTSYEPWNVVADENGNINTTWYIFTEQLIGATMQVTATGQISGLTASATFTDAINVTFYEDAARTIARDAFTWGSTVNARLSQFNNNKCYRLEWRDPSNTVVQTHDFNPTNAANDDDSYTLPPSLSSGIWTVNVYEGTSNGMPCNFASPLFSRTFDVARAVIIGAVADSYVDETNTGANNGAAQTLVVDHKSTTDEKRAFLRFDLPGFP